MYLLSCRRHLFSFLFWLLGQANEKSIGKILNKRQKPILKKGVMPTVLFWSFCRRQNTHIHIYTLTYIHIWLPFILFHSHSLSRGEIFAVCISTLFNSNNNNNKIWMNMKNISGQPRNIHIFAICSVFL